HYPDRRGHQGGSGQPREDPRSVIGEALWGPFQGYGAPRRSGGGADRTRAMSWTHHATGVAVLSAAALLLAIGCAGRSSNMGETAGGELPPPGRQVLPNGLRLIVQDHRPADVVAVYLYVGVGVRYERPDQLGYSHFQEHMLFKGTDKWGPGYIDRAVEGVGGRTNATTSFDYTDFYIVGPTDATEIALQTLADMV